MSKPRSIFEEVASDEPLPPVQAATSVAKGPSSERGAIAAWLMILFVLVALMVLVGGMTRLTDSGLSITEWRPVTGAVPPLDAKSWEAEFAKYQKIPQFALVNPEMTVGEFKSIYWWEWGHRQLGRAIGLVWAFGFAWFWLRRKIPTGWTSRLLIPGFLGGLQGAIGWWMVASGLGRNMISVASYRLAVHLGLAFIILGLIVWYVLMLRRKEADLLQARRQRTAAMLRWGGVLVAATFIQILLGALVAGIDAGRGFIDWPLMNGRVFPEGALSLSPAWRNLLENAGLVQFNHRLAGYLLTGLVVIAWLRSRKSASAYVRQAFSAVGLMTVLQLALGIYTVLTASPWQVAIIHQLGSIVLFSLVIRARFAAAYPVAQGIDRA